MRPERPRATEEFLTFLSGSALWTMGWFARNRQAGTLTGEQRDSEQAALASSLSSPMWPRLASTAAQRARWRDRAPFPRRFSTSFIHTVGKKTRCSSSDLLPLVGGELGYHAVRNLARQHDTPTLRYTAR